MAQIEQEIKPFDFSHAKECGRCREPHYTINLLVQLDDENAKAMINAIKSGSTDFTVRAPHGSVRIVWEKKESK